MSVSVCVCTKSVIVLRFSRTKTLLFFSNFNFVLSSLDEEVIFILRPLHHQQTRADNGTQKTALRRRFEHQETGQSQPPSGHKIAPALIGVVKKEGNAQSLCIVTFIGGSFKKL